jgi:hypothetical protein
MSLAYFRQLPHPQAYVVPYARKISSKEQAEVDKYRRLREAHHEGPYYSVIDASASSAKKGSAARANFDPFTGMPSYSRRYQKKHRTIPKIAGVGRDYGEFPRKHPGGIFSLLYHSKATVTNCVFEMSRNAILPSRALADYPAQLPTRCLIRRLPGPDQRCQQQAWIRR